MLSEEESTEATVSVTGSDTGSGTGCAAGLEGETVLVAFVRLEAAFLEAGTEAEDFAEVLVVLAIIMYHNKSFLSVLTHNILYYTIKASYS